MTLTYQKLKKAVYIYISLPLILFFLLYMHSLVGVLAAAITIFLLVSTFFENKIKCRKTRKETGKSETIASVDLTKETSINIPHSVLFALIIIAVIWSFLGGQGNHWYQSSDWWARNAIFRDLINHRWPVVYNSTNMALVYYIGYWLPAAAMVKFIGIFIPSIYRKDLAFVIGNQFLWLYTAVGLFLIFLLLIVYIKPKSQYKMYAVPAVFIFFSGLDIIGVIIMTAEYSMAFPAIHIEWWTPHLQFSSITTCLFWVFNQALITWLVILCVLMEKTIAHYVFLGLCALIAGPIPFLGIFVYMVGMGIILLKKNIRDGTIRVWMKTLFTSYNILSIPLMIPIYLYYSSNMAVQAGVSDNGEITLFRFLNIAQYDITIFVSLVRFLVLEAGLYLFFLFAKYKKDPFYWITIISVCIAPLFKIGTADDFVMRFSIPSITVMSAMIGKYLLGDYTKIDAIVANNQSKSKLYVRTSFWKAAILICFLIGSVTPLTEFFRGYSRMLLTGKFDNTYDTVYTLEGNEYYLNFLAEDYENITFFKFLT